MKIDGFDWDRGNAKKILQRHGVSDREVEEALLNEPLLIFSDPKHSEEEERHVAFGRTSEGRFLAIAFTLREKEERIFLRPVSARPMHRKERKLYEEAITETEEL